MYAAETIRSLDPANQPADCAGGIACESEFGPFRLVARARTLEEDGRPVKLGSRAFDLLCLLVRRAGQVVHKDELLNYAWPNLTVDESSLRFHITQLRRALRDGCDGVRYIVNIPGRGYCFVAPLGREAVRGSVRSERSTDPDPLCVAAPLLGRDQLVASAALTLQAKRHVTLRGPGGVGKSSIAREVARLVSREGGSAVRFIDLASHPLSATAGPSLSQIWDGTVPAAAPPTLFVVDGCERAIETAAALAERLLSEIPGSLVLVTSREALRSRGETVVDVTPLATAPVDAPPTLSLLDYPAVQLFWQCAVAGGYDGQPAPCAARKMAAICHDLGGLPLAIELVASRVGTFGLDDTARLVRAGRHLFWRGRRTADARHQSLAANLQWSCSLLSDFDRSILSGLLELDDSFTLNDAVHAATLSGQDIDQAADAIERLVARSLLEITSRSRKTLYRLQTGVRAYLEALQTGASPSSETGTVEDCTAR